MKPLSTGIGTCLCIITTELSVLVNLEGVPVNGFSCKNSSIASLMQHWSDQKQTDIQNLPSC